MQDASTRTYLQPQPVSLSPDLVAKLKAAQGEGLSRDPKNNPRKTIKLLQDKDDEYPTAAEVAATLRGKRQADGSYMCSCPGPLHRNGDRNPSLSVKDGRNRLLLHCFAGCAYDEIVTVLRGRGSAHE